MCRSTPASAQTCIGLKPGRQRNAKQALKRAAIRQGGRMHLQRKAIRKERQVSFPSPSLPPSMHKAAGVGCRRRLPGPRETDSIPSNRQSRFRAKMHLLSRRLHYARSVPRRCLGGQREAWLCWGYADIPAPLLRGCTDPCGMALHAK